jgi:hypothetical protein
MLSQHARIRVRFPTSEFPGDPFPGLLYADSWTVFDLRPPRPFLHDNRRLTAPPELFGLALLDAMRVVAFGEPSAPLNGVLEALRDLVSVSQRFEPTGPCGTK